MRKRPRKRNKMLVSIVGIILYVLLQLYVGHTPTPADDHLPDLALKLLASNQE